MPGPTMRFAAGLCVIVVVLISPEVFCQDEPECICLEELRAARGLKNPVVLRSALDGTNRKFIAEQTGEVWIHMPDGVVLPKPFLNLTEIILTTDRFGDERGFLTLAFHPEYSVNGRVFIYYSLEIDGEDYTRLSEVTLYEGSEVEIDPESERILLDIPQPFANHNGGELLFLDDGTLLAFTGDGGSGGDPFDNSQNKGTYLGKVLRIDVDGRSEGREYGIPDDNPFLDDEGAIPELYALGLRNPWRAQTDLGDRETGEGRGRIFIGDVGQNGYEEVNLLEKGGNYGWAAREGPQCYKQNLCGNIGPEVFPIYYYDHRDGRRCIIGGHVYRGCANPRFNGWYFYADFVTGQIFRLKEAGNGEWNSRELITCATCPEGLTNDYAEWILSWGMDEQGEVYFLATDDPSTDNRGGAIYRVVDPESNREPCIL